MWEKDDVILCLPYIALGTAFLLVHPQDLPERLEESGLIERIKTFVQVHRNSFLLLFAPFFGKKELDFLSGIQHRYINNNKSMTVPLYTSGSDAFSLC